MKQHSWILILLCITIIPSDVNSDCSKPELAQNVLVEYLDIVDGSKINELTRIKLKCKPGFHGLQANIAICLESEWKVISSAIKNVHQIRCKEKPCPFKIPENGYARQQGKKVIYSCKEKYKLIGHKQDVCKLNENGDYYLQKNLPKCIKEIMEDQPTLCKIPFIPALLYNGTEFFNIGQVSAFFCADGFELVGANFLTCESSGNWSGELPHCQIPPSCNDPGISIFSDRNGECCQVGTTLTYFCLDGYELLDKNSEKTITCLLNETWSESRPICKPIGTLTCSSPPLENNLVIDHADGSHPDIFLPGDEVHFTCAEYYVTYNKSLTLMCLEDGNWDHPFPICVEMKPCERPKLIHNGRIIELENNDRQFFPSGFEINLICDENYESSSNIYGSRCKNGKWEENLQNCTPITCNDPGVPEAGIRSGSNFQVGSKVTFRCNGNYQTIGSKQRQCLPNGVWSGRTTSCDNGESDCVDPGVPVNSYRRGNKFNFGDVVVYSCRHGSRLIGNATRECLPNGKWSGEEIKCLGIRHFSDPSELSKILEKLISGKRIQLFFLWDVSASINEYHFNWSKKFIKFIIHKIDAKSDKKGDRLGVITFSSSASELLTIDLEKVVNAIPWVENFERKAFGTNMVMSIKKFTELTSFTRFDEKQRNKTKIVVFIISDGRITEGGSPVEKIKYLHQYFNVDFHVVAVGHKLNNKFLTELAPKGFIFSNRQKLFDSSMDDTQKDETEVKKIKTNLPNCGITSLNSSFGVSSPWLAALQFRPIIMRKLTRNLFDIVDKVLCHGVIIHKDWILSAANCFVSESNRGLKTNLLKNKENWIVIVGRNNRSISSGYEIKIDEIIIHPQFDLKNSNFDVALIRLNNSINFDNFALPICLPPNFEELPNDTLLYKSNQIVSSFEWKYSNYKSSDSKSEEIVYLNENKLYIKVDDECKNDKHYGFSNQMFCAGTKNNAEVCSGDNSGPVIQQIPFSADSKKDKFVQNQWFVIGVRNLRVKCENSTNFAYFTNISKMHSWISIVTNATYEN